MALSQIVLPVPTPEAINARIRQYDREQEGIERALSKLFTTFTGNIVYENVLLKVVALNALYGTGILAVHQVAQHICNSNIDSMLVAGNPDVVEKVAIVQIGSKFRNNYSFASKYCSWHNSDAYPIYDSYVANILWAYSKQDTKNAFDSFYRYEAWSYRRFKEIILKFQSHYNLSDFSLKDIDKYLWLTGKEIFPRNTSATLS